MGWQDLLQKPDEHRILPWVGGRVLRARSQAWTLTGRRPPEFGWHDFVISGRNATWAGPKSRYDATERLVSAAHGILVGNRFLKHDVRVELDPKHIFDASEEVFLIDEGIDRFMPISVGRIAEDGPLLFDSLAMPTGIEQEVLTAFLDRKENLDHIKGVTPALDAAFRMECLQRELADRRRIELERLRQEEEAQRAKEARRAQLISEIGNGASRRELATIDFEAAARAALAIGGAEYLDHRNVSQHEVAVRFRFENQRFECTCDLRLRIIDAGICLRGYDDYLDEEVRGDDRFTLESLPAVIHTAIEEGVLHVFR